MTGSGDDASEGTGSMYDAVRAALLGTTRGDSSQQVTRRVAGDALARLGEPPDGAGEISPSESGSSDDNGESGQEERA